MKRQVKRIADTIASRKGIAFVLLFVVGFLAISFASFKTAEAAQARSCLAQGFSTGYTSTYTGACLGETSGVSFVELAVTLPNAVANAQVSFRNAQGNCGQSPCNFRKINNQTYVLNADARNLGYQVSGDSATCATAVTTDRNNQVTITVSGNGQTETIGPIDLCQEVISRNWTITRTANTIPGDNGQASSQGQIVGSVTTTRPGAPAGDPRKTGQAQKSGVIRITLKRQGGATLEGNNSSSWYTLVNGRLTIPNLDAGTYDLVLEYNDRVNATRDNIPAEWASADITMTQTGIVVRGGQDTTINLTGGADATAQAGQGTNEPQCTTGPGLAGALAWILCPAVQLIASATDFFENNIIIPFLTISPFTANANNPLYILWQDTRNIADFAFVGFFLVMVFSQVTGWRLETMGFKRNGGRAVAIVIGINLSYFGFSFVTDVFNILGAGLNQLAMSAITQGNVTQYNSGSSSGAVRSIFTLGGAALLTVVVSGGAAIGWFFSFLGIVALVIVAVVLILVARAVALDGLAIAAPIALLMAMLPNTQNFTRTWWKWTLQLEAMFPYIVGVFAAGSVASYVLIQPDFRFYGSDVSDSVAQAIRVFLQFGVKGASLILILFAATATNAGMAKIGGWVHNARTRGFAKKGGELVNQNMATRRQELKTHLAQRGGAVGWAAGYGMRRDFKKEQRERELGRARNEYLANEVLRPGSGLAGAAAGMGGQAGVTRVQANAVSQLEKLRQEEISNEGAILQSELRRVGISTKEFNNGLNDFLEGKGTGVVPGTAIDAKTGQKLSIDLTKNERLLRAALNTAADNGEVTTLENARKNSHINQNMLDEVIRNNEGKIKAKGGFHLATDFSLAYGRMTEDVIDPATGLPQKDAQGNNVQKLIELGEEGSLIRQQAQIKMNQKVKLKRLVSAANTAASDVADMKSSTLGAIQASLLVSNAKGEPIPNAAGNYELSPEGINLWNSLSAADKAKFSQRLSDIVGNPNLIGKAQNREAIKNMFDLLPKPPKTP